MIAASQSTPTSPYPWQKDYTFPLLSKNGFLYKHDPSTLATAGFEQRVLKRLSQDDSLLHPDDASHRVCKPHEVSKESSNDFIDKSFIASPATRGKQDEDGASIGELSIEPGKLDSPVPASSPISGLRGRHSHHILRLKMSEDRMRESQGRLYIDEDGQKSFPQSFPTQPRLQLSESSLKSETAPGPGSQPSPIRVPKRASSARHSIATPGLSRESVDSDVSPGSIGSPRRVPNRDSSLRHSFSASPAHSRNKPYQSSPRESRYTTRSSAESELGFPEHEFAKVLDDLAEDDVSRRIKELKTQKRMREHDLTLATLDLPPATGASSFDLAALKLRLSNDKFAVDGPEGMYPTPPAHEADDSDIEASAAPPAIVQRLERNTNTGVSSLWSNTSASSSPIVKQVVEPQRMHSRPPQRSNSKLFRRLSRPISPTTTGKHRRTFSEDLSTPQSPFKERPTSVDSTIQAVHDYLSSQKLSQKVNDSQTGRVISFSEVGDPTGSVVFCCVGMGLTRYITAFYDELAVTLKLRLITPDRPGVGASEPNPDGSDTPLGWPDDVRVICACLKISKFSLLAHSAGAIYALATALRMPQHIRGRIHLLAPWIPPSQMSAIGTQQEALPAKSLPYSQRFLRSLPTTFLKAANSSFLSATSASITTSLPKSPRRSKQRTRGADSVDFGLHRQDESPSPQLPRINSEPFRVNSFNKENFTTEAAALRPCLANRGSSRLSQKERQHTFDALLTEAIWEYATTDANPAVDLLVCLERRQPIGFRYVDITKAIVIHHGSKDTRVPVENVKWLGKTMRKCEVRVLEGEGHGLMASAGVMGTVLMEMAQEWEDWNRATQGRGTMERRVTAGI